MARAFSTQQAKELASEHNKLQTRISDAQKLVYEDYKSEIRSAAENLTVNAVMKTLRTVPIEEIARGKKGIKVKPLRDAGFQTMADIATASRFEIASVRGISEDASYTIHRIVAGIVDTARKNTKVRLSTDDKSREATRLVKAISVYRQSLPYAKVCRELDKDYGKNIAGALVDLSAGNGTFKWLFSSRSRKDRTSDAYRYLSELLNGRYGAEACGALDDIEELKNLSGDEAWSDFSRNSIRFFNILEDIAPNVLGSDDSMYGLPKNLARDVQDQAYFPDGLLCELRRYQEWGVKYALHQERVLLGDEMGLGKTVQAIATMVSLKNTGGTHFLVVCPASVVSNWVREIGAKSKLRVSRIHGSGKSGALSSWKKLGGVAVTTYETTSLFHLEDDFRFSMLVVDEAHYIKNPEARRTVNTVAIAEHADRLLFMTGTALENKVEEMISLIRILQPEVASRIHGMESLSSAPAFREMVAPVYYRRKREDVLTELPEKIESKEWCTLLPEEERIYEQAVFDKRYADARRVSWNVEDLANSSKARRLLELVDEAEADGRKVIVFSFFLDTIRKITDLLGERCGNPITGSVTPQRRQEIIDEFDRARAGTVLAAQIQSGGTGLNIQSASVVILCEPQLKPSIENQAISRAYRMGQTRNVLVYRLLCENTVDERITDQLARKQAVFDAFADKSVAAKESAGIDEKGFGDIIQEEIDRINAKRAKEAGKETVS